MASYTYDNLMADLKRNQYTPKTQEELQKEAAGRYDSAYAEKELAARQAAAISTAALERQLASLGTNTAKQQEESRKAYNQAYSQVDRAAVGRNMGRSSYNLATLANIANEGNKAQQAILDAEATTRAGIEEQKTLFATQLAQKLEQYAAGKTSDTNSYLDQLLSREYDRETAANDKFNDIAMSLYDIGYQTERDKVSDAREQQKLDYQTERDKVSDALDQQRLAEDIRQFDVLNPPKRDRGKLPPPTPTPTPKPEYTKLPNLWKLLGRTDEQLSKDLSNPNTASKKESGSKSGGRYTK